MTYDPIDTNGDGVVDAPVDNESVNTGQIKNNGSPISVEDTITRDSLSNDPQNPTLIRSVGTGAETQANYAVATTAPDDNTSTDLIDLPTQTGYVRVSGFIAGTGYFADHLVISVTTIDKRSVGTGAATRTYNRASSTGMITISIDGSGGTTVELSVGADTGQAFEG